MYEYRYECTEIEMNSMAEMNHYIEDYLIYLILFKYNISVYVYAYVYECVCMNVYLCLYVCIYVCMYISL